MEATSFSHGCVRDLAWAGFAPTLLTGEPYRGAELVYGDYWQRSLQALDRDPEPLLVFLGDSVTGRLGLYYERLWHFLLEHDPDTELLAHNLPVREGNRTVGEFDCLYWSSRAEAHIHLELAVKFYLGVPDQGIWLGPGAHDRLDIKLERLLQHQGRLSEHPAAASPLAELGISHCESRVDIKGYLFSPLQDMPMPTGFNEDNPQQYWYSLSDFRALQALPENWAGWQKIPRSRWLSRFHSDEGKARSPEELMSWLESHMGEHGRPVLLAACNEQGVEIHRCFVTPDSWPEPETKKRPAKAGQQ